MVASIAKNSCQNSLNFHAGVLRQGILHETNPNTLSMKTRRGGHERKIFDHKMRAELGLNNTESRDIVPNLRDVYMVATHVN